jgi:hypothetical protein
MKFAALLTAAWLAILPATALFDLSRQDNVVVYWVSAAPKCGARTRR